MAAKNDVGDLTGQLTGLSLEEGHQVAEKSVTEIIQDAFQGYSAYRGKEGIFEDAQDMRNIKRDGLREAADDKGKGNMLQYHIYTYLKEKGYETERKYKTYHSYDSTFGLAVWEKIEKDVERGTKKLLEAELTSYRAKGFADFYRHDDKGPSTLIDFKWTTKDHPYPSPVCALQLLLYQWMAGERFKEEKGARMYLIRFVDEKEKMQLIPFNPPEHLQYRQGHDGVKSYKDIVHLFMKEYYS